MKNTKWKMVVRNERKMRKMEEMKTTNKKAGGKH
jgi:hypothetical protein